MIHYRMDQPERVKCSVCGGMAEEVEETYPESGNFIMVLYRCTSCGHIEKRQYGRPVKIID
ncbi:hypothetical protein [Methanothermobacter wolfeii]|uniref:hypothetical protein n=1 Tax=Methanothermobacter wolfeii TaxID=145261 RepID=UPI0024B3B0D9|nr:hypothetical protein [Methanothermobacter wolfeii]MDI6701531.1 hypothetical protein [Methanothermobacter wolfeii]